MKGEYTITIKTDSSESKVERYAREIAIFLRANVTLKSQTETAMYRSKRWGKYVRP